MAKKKNGKNQPEKKISAVSQPAEPAAKAAPPVRSAPEEPAPEKTMPEKPADTEEEVPLTDGEWTTTENVFERIEEKKAEASRPVKTRVIQAPRRTDTASGTQDDAPEEYEEERKTVHHGPPRTEEERQRILAAESLLDRDLSSAVRKRTAEEEEDIRRFEAMQKREAERVARLQANKEHREMLKQQAKEREQKARERGGEGKPLGGKIEHTSETGTVSHGTSKAGVTTADKLFRRDLSQLSAGRAVFVILIMAVLAYIGLFIYTKHLNDTFYDELSVQLTSENKIVHEKSTPYKMPENSGLSIEQKYSIVLSPWLADTDKDGLSDYYEVEHDTNPVLSDTDEDGINDGLEVSSGLDPLKVSTDGVLQDGEIRGDATISADNVTIFIHSIPKPCLAFVEPVGNNSINGTPGLVCNAEEFYTDQKFRDALLSFVYPKNIVDMYGYNETALSVFRFESETLEFVPVKSTIDLEKHTVSAVVTEGGIYTVADASVLMQKGKTQIFFLIDNSGSMYPEELCKGSEENDVEFKRLDLAEKLIDMFDDTALYGAGEFSGTYNNVVPISGDTALVKNKIDAIRTRTNNIFTGTEISNAVEKAIMEFGQINKADKNYIILLTDGMNTTNDPARDGRVLAAAQRSHITIFTIGLGKNIDADYLSEIAAQTNGQFFQATNADALENIYEKIQNFMYYNQITLEEDTGRKGYIIADSGFNATRDGIGYNNFRADFAPRGADPGIAGLICDYFSGDLAISAPGYTTKDGKGVPGYDISGIAELADGKVDLRTVQIGILDRYNSYLSIKNKWGFSKLHSGGVLPYNESTREFIEKSGLKIITVNHDFQPPVETETEIFLKKITFNEVKSFNGYQSVQVDSSALTDSDKQLMNMIQWYYFLPSSDKAEVFDFGYQGDAAFELLVNQLTTGKPAVVFFDESAFNAVRLMRDTNDPNLYVLDAYDSNSPDRSIKIEIVRTPIYTENGSSYQYTSSRNGVEAPLLISVNK